MKTPSNFEPRNFVVVFMPFAETFLDVWNGGIKPAVLDCNLDCRRIDEINECIGILELVQSLLENEHCVGAVVDITGQRPNVFLELGAALAELEWKRGLPVVVISQSAGYLSTDIHHLKSIIYASTWSGIEKLRMEVRDHLELVAA